MSADNLVLADCFILKLENNQFNSVIDWSNLNKRYKDDTFIIFNENIELIDILSSFNTYYTFLDFTLENESGHFISLHDMLLTKCDETLKRFIYRKQTWNAQLTNFYSCVPLSRKRNLIRYLCYQINTIYGTKCTENLSFSEKRWLTSVIQAAL